MIDKSEETSGQAEVIIVEDDEDLIEMIQYAFQAHGVQTKFFLSGKEALQYFSHEENISPKHLLILDRLLPDMDGIDILKHLLQKHFDKAPMVLILSVLGSDHDVVQGFEAGAIDYLSKPFNLEVLIDKALVLLSRSKRT